VNLCFRVCNKDELYVLVDAEADINIFSFLKKEFHGTLLSSLAPYPDAPHSYRPTSTSQCASELCTTSKVAVRECGFSVSSVYVVHVYKTVTI
jgi:hypothetical protein